MINLDTEITPLEARNRVACGLAEGMIYRHKYYGNKICWKVKQDGLVQLKADVLKITDLVQDKVWTLTNIS